MFKSIKFRFTAIVIALAALTIGGNAVVLYFFGGLEERFLELSTERLVEIDQAEQLTRQVMRIDTLRQQVEGAKSPEILKSANILLREALDETRVLLASRNFPNDSETIARVEAIGERERAQFEAKSDELELEKTPDPRRD